MMMMMVRIPDGRRSLKRPVRTVRYVTVGTLGGLIFGGGNLNSLTEPRSTESFKGITPEFKNHLIMLFKTIVKRHQLYGLSDMWSLQKLQV